MAQILMFLRDAAFDADTTHVMGQAFDRACVDLAATGCSPLLVREMIAKRILVDARQGERDPDRLCQAALTAIGIKPDTAPPRRIA